MSRGLGRNVPSQSPIQAAAVVVAPVISFQNPLGVKGFCYRRVKNDVRDAGDLADLLRMGRLPEAGSPHRRPANCGSWCAIEPSWWRSDRDSRRRSMPYWPRPAY